MVTSIREAIARRDEWMYSAFQPCPMSDIISAYAQICRRLIKPTSIAFLYIPDVKADVFLLTGQTIWPGT